MPVYFAYRDFDLGPTGKYLKQFDDDTVLDWFRRHWEHLAIEEREQADERLTEVLGCDGWFLWNPFQMAAAEGLPPPESDEALMGLLRRCMGDDNFAGSPHSLQVFTEEDGEGGAHHRSELRTTHHSLIQVDDHLAQACLDVSWTDDPYFSQWLVFDDLWASAHPDLANAILRFAARWDVLSGD